MNNTLIQLSASIRTVQGKKNKALRRAGKTPANIVAAGKSSISIEINTMDLVKILDQVGYTQAVQLTLGDKKITVLVTEVTFMPLQNIPEHVIFFEVKKGLQVNASVPIALTGEAVGERMGLMVLQTLDEVEVSASALSIPETLEVDISQLSEDGDVIRLENIDLPSGVEINLDLQTPIVRLEKSRSQVSQESTGDEVEGDESESDESEADSDQSSVDDTQGKED